MAAEFVILNLGSDPPKLGSAYTILAVTSSEQDARTFLGTLPIAAASKVAILEKKALINRIPSVRLEDLQGNIIPT